MIMLKLNFQFKYRYKSITIISKIYSVNIQGYILYMQSSSDFYRRDDRIFLEKPRSNRQSTPSFLLLKKKKHFKEFRRDRICRKVGQLFDPSSPI